MKKIILIALAVFSVLIASTVSAAPGDQCAVTSLDIETIATEITTKIEMDYQFECQPDAGGEQVNKMVVTIPYRDVYNVIAADAIGDMKVFEGPEYARVVNSDTDSTIGSFFRKSIVMNSNSTTGYLLTLEFQSDLLVKENEKIFTVNPKGLGAKPKITVVGSGVTETPIPVSDIDYKITLPDGSAVTSSPNGCSLSEGEVLCEGLTAAELDKIEIKWTGSGPGVMLTRVRDVVQDVPGAFTKIFKSFKNIFSSILG